MKKAQGSDVLRVIPGAIPAEWLVVDGAGNLVDTEREQNAAIDNAMERAASIGARVEWEDDYVGKHVAYPARLGWFSTEVKRMRGGRTVL